jgi:hypothetical protein
MNADMLPNDDAQGHNLSAAESADQSSQPMQAAACFGDLLPSGLPVDTRNSKHMLLL